jgi:transposase
MIPVTGSTRIFLYRGATDMRRSFNGLSAMVEQILREDPLSGALFVFCNRRRNLVKILYWDGDGFALWYKRLEQGTFRIPCGPGDKAHMNATDLSVLLQGIVPLRFLPRFELKNTYK